MKTSSVFVRAGFALVACASLVAAFFCGPGTATAADPQPTLPPYQTLTPIRILGVIRRVYREHRPPPPYETYTEDYKVWTNYGTGGLDYAESHVKHYWVRNVDRAALVRLVYHDDYDGDLTFDRPALNQDRDPGPPTADLFEPAHPQPVSFVPTPEPTAAAIKTIAQVYALGEFEYNVAKMTVEGNDLHLVLQPKRDPERNVLREIWADKQTYVLRRVISHDRMFINALGHVYPVRQTFRLGYLDGYVVITHLDATVLPKTDADYSFEDDTGDQPKVEIDFKDITFPQSLPDWYFNPREYRQHLADAPQ